MPYRPQFAYPPAPGNCRDEEFEYFFDKSNTPGLAVTLTPQGQQNNIPLVLDKDAVFLCRGIKIGNPSTVLGVQFKDPSGNQLSDDYEPAADYSGFSGQSVQPGSPPRAMEPEIECPAGAALILNIKDIDPPAPVLQYSLSTTVLGAIPMRCYAVGGQGASAAIIPFKGALYQVLQFNLGGNTAATVAVFRSVDGGNTWTILDSAHNPATKTDSTPSGGILYDGVNTITVALTAGSPITPASSAIVLWDFNLLTGTWGAAYGAGSAAVFAVNQIYKRSDGSLLVIAWGTAGGTLTANVLSGGAWSAFSLSSLLPGGWTQNGSSSTVYDPATDTIHMFGLAQTAGPVNHSYYQQILIGNTIGGFQDLTAVFFPTFSAMGNPLLVKGQILWGVADTTDSFATLLVGTPLTVPVFSVLGSPGIDPNAPTPVFVNTLQPTLATDGATLFAVYGAHDPAGNNLVRLAKTANLANPKSGWSAATLFDDVLGTALPGGSAQYPTVAALTNGTQSITIEASAPGAVGASAPTDYVLEAGSQQIAVTLRGVKRYPAVRHTSACAVV